MHDDGEQQSPTFGRDPAEYQQHLAKYNKYGSISPQRHHADVQLEDRQTNYQKMLNSTYGGGYVTDNTVFNSQLPTKGDSLMQAYKPPQNKPVKTRNTPLDTP